MGDDVVNSQKVLNREALYQLYTFMLVAKEMSFTKAASRLGSAQSGVSRSISELEANLGMTLILRSTRKLALTAAGEQLYLTLEQGFGQVDSGWSMLHYLRETPNGTVRINASRQAIEHLLLPKLASFGQDYPEINLELIENNHFVDIIQDRFDAGVRYGNAVSDDMVATRIGPDVQMALVASSKFFSTHGIPTHPNDLRSYPCIGYQLSDGSAYQWDFHDGNRVIRHTPKCRWLFSDATTIIQAAKMGLGLAYEAEDLVRTELENGELVRVMQQYSHTFLGFHLYYPHRNVSPALRLVIQILKI